VTENLKRVKCGDSLKINEHRCTKKKGEEGTIKDGSTAKNFCKVSISQVILTLSLFPATPTWCTGHP
jgi:hypothetical protein